MNQIFGTNSFQPGMPEIGNRQCQGQGTQSQDKCGLLLTRWLGFSEISHPDGGSSLSGALCPSLARLHLSTLAEPWFYPRSPFPAPLSVEAAHFPTALVFQALHIKGRQTSKLSPLAKEAGTPLPPQSSLTSRGQLSSPPLSSLTGTVTL